MMLSELHQLNDGFVNNFAHQPFRWKNEAKGNAAVFCAIVGFGRPAGKKKKLYSYSDESGDPVLNYVDDIGPYLIPNERTIVKTRNKPLTERSPMVYGNKPAGKAFIISPEERDKIIVSDPACAPYCRRFHGADDFLNGGVRYCLWFAGLSEQEVLSIHTGIQLIDKIALERMDDKTGKLKKQHQGYPLYLFRQVTQPDGCNCLLVPSVSSERRNYIPMGYIQTGEIIGNSCHLVPNASYFDFAILESRMHMTWMRTVCGRLESRYRYSRDLCYNTIRCHTNFRHPFNLSWSGKTCDIRRSSKTTS